MVFRDASASKNEIRPWTYGQILTWCLTNFYLFLPLWASACMEAIVIDIITFTITFMIIARNIIIAVIINILSHIITVIATIDKIVLMIRKVCLPPVWPAYLQCPRIYFQNRQGSPRTLLLKVPPTVTWQKKVEDHPTFDSESCLSRLSIDSSFEETPFSSSVLFLTSILSFTLARFSIKAASWLVLQLHDHGLLANVREAEWGGWKLKLVRWFPSTCKTSNILSRDMRGGLLFRGAGRGKGKNPRGGAGRGGAKVKIRGAGRKSAQINQFKNFTKVRKI